MHGAQVGGVGPSPWCAARGARRAGQALGLSPWCAARRSGAGAEPLVRSTQVVAVVRSTQVGGVVLGSWCARYRTRGRGLSAALPELTTRCAVAKVDNRVCQNQYGHTSTGIRYTSFNIPYTSTCIARVCWYLYRTLYKYWYRWIKGWCSVSQGFMLGSEHWASPVPVCVDQCAARSVPRPVHRALSTET